MLLPLIPEMFLLLLSLRPEELIGLTSEVCKYSPSLEIFEGFLLSVGTPKLAFEFLMPEFWGLIPELNPSLISDLLGSLLVDLMFDSEGPTGSLAGFMFALELESLEFLSSLLVSG